jgi:hypothetical protein
MFQPSEKCRCCFGSRGAAAILPRILFAADHGHALDLDLGIGIGQAGDRDQGAAGEIVAEYLFSYLRQPIAIADVGDEDGHLDHVAKLAAGLLKRGAEQLEDLPSLPLEIAGDDLPVSSTVAVWPASHTVLPPSVMTASE